MFLNSIAYLTTHILFIPLWNIRNKLCQATTQISWVRNVEERHDFLCRNGDKEFQNRNLLFKHYNLYGISKMLSLERHHKSNFTISTIYGCRNKLRFFSWAKLALDHADFMQPAALRERVSISCMWPVQSGSQLAKVTIVIKSRVS